MATFVQYYAGESEGSKFMGSIENGAIVDSIGHLAMEPREAFRVLMPEFYVIRHLWVRIRSRDDCDNRNIGLILTPSPGGIGLNGTIDMLLKDERFASCRHSFSEDERKKIVERMLWQVEPGCWHNQPFDLETCKNYSEILSVLGKRMTPEEIKEMSTPEGYYKPVTLYDVIPRSSIPGPEPEFPVLDICASD